MSTFQELHAEAILRQRAGSLIGQPWPHRTEWGGYGMLYFTDDGEYLCHECMNTQPIHFAGHRDGWRIDAVDCTGNTESEYDEHCAHCNALVMEGYMPVCDECDGNGIVMDRHCEMVPCPRCGE